MNIKKTHLIKNINIISKSYLIDRFNWFFKVYSIEFNF